MEYNNFTQFLLHPKAMKKNQRVTNDQAQSDDIIESNILPPDDVFAYNELRSCADLYRMYKAKDLEIKPNFQRNDVWTNADMTRFIDSLVKGLPIPSMCFSLGKNTQKWKVIDGLQRMFTISKFLDTENKWSLSNLEDIDSRISNKSNMEIQRGFPDIYKRIENLTLPITVLRCDYNNRSHEEYLFLIFARLNAGGMRLNAQEIRNCIYSGNFNELLKELAKNDRFRKIYKITDTQSTRMKDTEFILRLFAFSEEHSKYNNRLTKFLNEYMYNKRSVSATELNIRKTNFLKTIEFVYSKIVLNNESFKTDNSTFRETLMVGAYINISNLENIDTASAISYYTKLKKHSSLEPGKVAEGVWKRQRVADRFGATIKIFSGK